MGCSQPKAIEKCIDKIKNVTQNQLLKNITSKLKNTLGNY